MVKILGFLLILIGLWAALLNHAFGGMIDPSVSDLEWWRQYLRTTWQGYLFCPALLFLGAWLLIGPPRRWNRNRWSPIEEPEHFLVIDREESI